MLQSEREKLYNRESEYLSIGISENGEGYGMHPVPWDYTANAYKMKLPKIYISKKDLLDEKLMAKICEFKVHGCYIFCPLENYDFLNRFTDMSDLNIYQAYNLENLSFLKRFKECRMLFVSKAHLKDINDVVGPEPYFMAKPNCLALYDCIVDDISYLKDKKVTFNELVICNPKSRDERGRWNGLYRVKYYDMRE